MKQRALITRLEAWAQEELGVQQRLDEALSEHERTLGAGRPDDVERSLRALEGVDRRGNARRRELDAVLRQLAAQWGVAASALTLGSVVERLGSEGERLGRLRATLREACTRVRERSRRVAVVARQQRAVVRQVLETVLGPEGLDGERGTVVDSRA